MPASRTSVLLATLLALAARGDLVLADEAKPASGTVAASSPAALEVESAKWESGYGVKFFQVVGSVANRGDRALGAVLIHTELLDASGKAVAEVDCWNGRAEALGELRGDAARAKLASARVEPIAAGASDKWRCTFLEEDTPKFEKHRATVAATVAAP
jgi:hypothetical protein